MNMKGSWGCTRGLLGYMTGWSANSLAKSGCSSGWWGNTQGFLGNIQGCEGNTRGYPRSWQGSWVGSGGSGAVGGGERGPAGLGLLGLEGPGEPVGRSGGPGRAVAGAEARVHG